MHAHAGVCVYLVIMRAALGGRSQEKDVEALVWGGDLVSWRVVQKRGAM